MFKTFEEYMKKMSVHDLLYIISKNYNLNYHLSYKSNKNLLEFYSNIILEDITININIVFSYLVNNDEYLELIILDIQELLIKLRNEKNINNPIFDVLINIQSVLGIAYWKFDMNIGKELELFVRDFDRLDNNHEKKWLIEHLDNYIK